MTLLEARLIASLVSQYVSGKDELLTPDRRRRARRGWHKGLTGHCYVACEAAYHLGLKDAGWRPMSMRVDGDTHWFLYHASLGIIDPTAKQFPFRLDYAGGRGRGFLTKGPSRRAKIVIDTLRGNAQVLSATSR